MSNRDGQILRHQDRDFEGRRQWNLLALIWQRALTWSKIPQEKFGSVGTGRSTRSTLRNTMYKPR
jgi:hypothetical protein